MLGGSKKGRKMPTLLFIQWKKFKERYRGNTHPKKNFFSLESYEIQKIFKT